ncbi:MAG: indole-3-glycerol phosphate synthase TrpC [Acidobacteria bacterium]|nr:MAG: indole-3-glycerol phosphate synthase TrpC [Acidobacteriota bacterium]
MTVLDEIINARRRRFEEARKSSPLSEVEEAAARRHERRDFATAISGKGLSVIAELKQASPSQGVLRQDYRPRELAQGYEAAGAAALSVLTEEDYFRGSLTDLIDARDAVSVPVLRKDFILDDYQVYESVAAGADALLLIVAALPDKELRGLIGLCERLRVQALVEVHTGKEMDRALDAGARTVGINNRNLKTMEVSLETSFRLRDRIPSRCIAVSESGIQTAAEVRSLGEVGFHAVLIGEHLMAAPDPGKELAEMLRGAEVRSQESEVKSQN